MTYQYFDAETLPDQRPGALERARENVKVPASYRNPDTIESYKDEQAHEAWLKTGLDGWKGHVACICIDDARFSISDVEDERHLLSDFFNHLTNSFRTLVGHNIIGFDIPFITKRALALGVKLPSEHLWPRNLKPWDTRVVDTMFMFGGGKEFVSLQTLADAFGLDGKTNHGGAVAQMWADGMHEEIVDYCAQDVRLVREVHQRFLSVGW